MAARYIDRNGYERGQLEHSDLIHRQIAYRHIYLPNRHLYPLQFRYYQVHHRDGNKRNNAVPNLQIITRKEHERIHGYGNPLRFIATLLGFLFFMLMLLFWVALMLARR